MKNSPVKYVLCLLVFGLLLFGIQTIKAQLTFNRDSPLPPQRIESMTLQTDGKILAAGFFNNIGGQTRYNVARFNTDLTLDNSFIPILNATAHTIAVQPNGKILIGGFFTRISEQTHYFLARFNADGTKDTSFNPQPDGSVYLIAAQPDGKILVRGQFDSIGGYSRNGFARLNADGTVDTTFNPVANGDILSFKLLADGKILVGGNFTGIGGQNRNYIARLNNDGTVDASFNSNIIFRIGTMEIQSDGKILFFGGLIDPVNFLQSRLGRLNADGTVDASFNPPSTNYFSAIVVQSDGKILVSGDFRTGVEQSRRYIARLNADGTQDNSFDPFPDDYVYSILLNSEGKILIGGQFKNIGGQPRSLFAQLPNDIAASQNLSISRKTINWTLSGSFPQFSRVSFEQSLDGVNFTALGSGTFNLASLSDLAGKKLNYQELLFAKETSILGNRLAPETSGWTLTNLNLPGGQNLYIRVRGFYGSQETPVERVQTVFLPELTAVSGRVTVGSRGILGATVSLTDARGETRSARTNSSGYYRFSDVAIGQTCTFRVKSKRHVFNPQIITIPEDSAEINFKAVN